MKGHLEVALGGIAAGGPCSTSEDSAVVGTLARRTSCAGRVPTEMQQTPENWIAECGRRWGGMVASSARLP